MITQAYPVQYIEPIQLKDGTIIQLRPVHPVDGEQAKAFRGKLSKESIYNRFLGYIPKISDKLIQRLTQIDYEKEMAIIAEVQNEHLKEIIAVARLASKQKTEAEFAIIIADKWQGKGLGSILSDYMISVATDMEFEKIYAWVFADNTTMIDILKHKGFLLKIEDYNTYRAELSLKN